MPFANAEIAFREQIPDESILTKVIAALVFMSVWMMWVLLPFLLFGTWAIYSDSHLTGQPWWRRLGSALGVTFGQVAIFPIAALIGLIAASIMGVAINLAIYGSLIVGLALTVLAAAKWLFKRRAA